MTEKCGSCEQMKKENSLNRKALMDTNKNYVEVVNENLSLRRELTAKNRSITNDLDILEVLGSIEPWVNTVGGMPVKTIQYKHNQIIVEWFTQEELDKFKELRNDPPMGRK